VRFLFLLFLFIPHASICKPNLHAFRPHARDLPLTAPCPRSFAYLWGEYVSKTAVRGNRGEKVYYPCPNLEAGGTDQVRNCPIL
jgi:hypothetical protein